MYAVFRQAFLNLKLHFSYSQASLLQIEEKDVRSRYLDSIHVISVLGCRDVICR